MGKASESIPACQARRFRHVGVHGLCCRLHRPPAWLSYHQAKENTDKNDPNRLF